MAPSRRVSPVSISPVLPGCGASAGRSYGAIRPELIQAGATAGLRAPIDKVLSTRLLPLDQVAFTKYIVGLCCGRASGWFAGWMVKAAVPSGFFRFKKLVDVAVGHAPVVALG